MKMNNLKLFDIKFTGLNNGTHRFQYHIDQSFLSEFAYDEAEKCDIEIDVKMNKSDNMLAFHIHSKGFINIPCDVSNEMYDQAVERTQEFLIKFGEEYNDERDDLIILPYNEHKYNIAQQIYENIILSIPMKRVHPDIISGKMKTNNTDYIINADDLDIDKKEPKEKDIDPRWEVLKKLLTDKKK